MKDCIFRLLPLLIPLVCGCMVAIVMRNADSEIKFQKRKHYLGCIVAIAVVSLFPSIHWVRKVVFFLFASFATCVHINEICKRSDYKVRLEEFRNVGIHLIGLFVSYLFIAYIGNDTTIVD